MTQDQIVTDCPTGEWVLLRSIGFTRNGSQVSDVQIPAIIMILDYKHQSPVPGTVGAAIQEFVCQY
jgi:hypothetical protein